MIGLKEIFPANSLEQWLERLKKDLKSEDLHELSIKDELEDIQITTYGHQDLVQTEAISPGQFPYTRGLSTESNDWRNAFYIKVDNQIKANEKALQVLMQGADSLVFEFKEDNVDLGALLKNIELQYIHTTFVPSTFEQVLAILKGLFTSAKSQISIAIDLNENSELKGRTKDLVQLVQMEQLPLFLADGFKLQQCGANISQELAFVLSTGNEYLNVLLNEGLTIDEAAACIHFRIGIGSNYFQEIAKIRALKLMWANIIKQYGPMHSCSYNCRITAQTGSMNKSAKDPNTNLLRQTTEALSALVGGVNQLAILPFDAESNSGVTTLAERMALNISLILKEESYLQAVIDPAGGSYTIEDLTDKFCDKAWGIFQTMDEKGGVFNEECSNHFLNDVRTSAKRRLEQIKNKEKTLIGVNKFPNPTPENNSFSNYGNYMGLNMLNFERDI